MSSICPTAGPPSGRSRLRRAFRGAPLAAMVAVASLGAASSAQAEVKLTSAFVAPIAGDAPKCTPEPAGNPIYGTDIPFGTGPHAGSTTRERPFSLPSEPDYIPANEYSRDTATKKLEAGTSNDLCFGFTLTPNGEDWYNTPSFKFNYRVQSNPPVANDPDTRVEDHQANDDLKSAVIDMPVGFVGDPDAIPTCSDDQLGLGNYKPVRCPWNSGVGTVFARVTAQVTSDNGGSPSYSASAHLADGGLPNFNLDPGTSDPDVISIDDMGRVFNLTHGPNELARLAAVIQPATSIAPIKVIVRLVLAPDGSGRIRAITENAPRAGYEQSYLEYTTGANPEPTGQLLPGAVPSQIYLESFAIRVFGSKGFHPTLAKDFAELGTDCSAPFEADVSIETYKGVKSSIKTDEPLKLSGCESLPFLPSLSVETTEKRPAVPTGVKVKVGLGQTTSGPKSALLKDAIVKLPAGLEIGAQVASGPNGLPLCSAAQFDKGSTVGNACPAGSKVGTATIISPLQSRPFLGNVYLGPQPAEGELPALYIEVAPEGADPANPNAPRVKLTGEAKVDAAGNLTTTFKDNPQLRFSELRLEFPAGPNALFSTPRKCGTTNATSQFISRASATPVNVDSSLTIDQGCDTPGFSPTFSMVPANAHAGASSPTKITIAREDRSPWLKDVKVSLPTGFLADLKVATECSKADAAAGSCPESARMGTVTTVAGVGESPLALKGAMYLVERDEGSVAGAVIVVDAKVGEIALGKVVVPAKIDLRTNDAGLTMTTSAPLRFKGLALNLRSIVVDLDRENFPLNPTACGPLRATAELTGENGEAAAPTSDVTYTGCAGLPFQPGFSAKISGDLKDKGYPQIDVTMTPRAGDANLRSAKVMLPAGLATDTANLKNVCPTDGFNAGNCDDATKVGTVKATVSITNDVVQGDVHLVRVEGSTLPGIGMKFTGRYAMRVLSRVSIAKDGRLVTEFGSIPDLPLRRLDMTIAGGPKAPIRISGPACKVAETAWEASLSGQGGQTSQVTQKEKCPGAAPKVVEPKQSLSWSSKKGLRLTITAPTGTKVKSAKLTLPSGFKITGKKTSRKKYVKISAPGAKKAKSKITSKTLSLSGSKALPTKVTFTLKPKGYTPPKKYKKKFKGKKLKIKTRVALSDGKVTSKTLTVKTK